MKVIINKNILINGLKFSNNIINQNNIYPILQSILISVENNELSIISSNNISSSKFIINKGFKSIFNGKVLIKSKTILNIILKLENEEVLLEKIDNSLLKIKSGNFDCNLNILNDEEYPNIKFDYKELNNIKINSNQLIEIDKKISHSVNMNIEKSSIFNGILFDSESEDNFLKIIASNTYKMSYIKYPFNGEKIKIILEPSIIKNILEFTNEDEIILFKVDNKIIIKLNNIIISTRNIEGEYPNIDKIINQQNLYNFSINKTNLQNLLNRGYSLISNENRPIANFKITEKNILISFKSIEIGFSSENIEIESNIINNIEFNINILFLISLLKSFNNNEIIFYIDEINKPIILRDLKDKNYIQVLVPLRNS